MSRRKAPQPEHDLTNPNITLVNLLTFLLGYILHSTDRKPSPEAWDALVKLDEMRQQLQDNLGTEVTELHDPQGRLNYPPAEEGGK